MKSRILKDYQLECFQRDLQIKNDSVILTVNDEKKNAYYVLDGLEKHEIDYWYAIFYF
ncbi:MAG: hypothetical protein IJO32_00705 [Bacilli bacterium]|nr:hypothetical protein [Bacilli bacterium]